MPRLKILINRILNFILAIILILLSLRVIFRLFGANPASPFVSWVFALSGFFVSPFRGIFSSPTVEGRALDIPALIAMLAYILVFFILMALINLLFQSTAVGSHTDSEADHHREGTQNEQSRR